MPHEFLRDLCDDKRNEVRRRWKKFHNEIFRLWGDETWTEKETILETYAQVEGPSKTNFK